MGSAHRGIVSAAIVGERVWNPIVLIDEIEKAVGDRRTMSGELIQAMHKHLLSPLEPVTARAWRCLYYGVPIDTRRVSYLMTANSLEGLSAPLLSRMRVYRPGHLSVDHLAHAAQRQAAAAGLHEDVGDVIAIAVAATRRRRHVHLREVSELVSRMVQLEMGGPRNFLD